MKRSHSRLWLVAFFVLGAVLLSACQINFITAINKNGSGLFTEEIGFTQAELMDTGMNNANDVCNQANSDQLPATIVQQETRNNNETWCVYKTSFSSLTQLKSYYSNSDISYDQISLENGTLTYDVTLDMTNTYGFTVGGTTYWEVTMPGKITSTNADEKTGNTLRWKLTAGKSTRILAVSDVNASAASPFKTFLTVVASCLGVAACCLLVVLLIALIVVLIVRKNKKKIETIAEPVEIPPEQPTNL